MVPFLANVDLNWQFYFYFCSKIGGRLVPWMHNVNHIVLPPPSISGRDRRKPFYPIQNATAVAYGKREAFSGIRELEYSLELCTVGS